MPQVVAIASVFLVSSQAFAAAPLPLTDEQISGSFYKHARIKALTVEVSKVSEETMREVADALVHSMTKDGSAGLQEMRIGDDGSHASFLVIKKDKGQATRAVIKTLSSRSDKVLVVIASWPMRLDAELSTRLEMEASAIEHSHAFDRGVDEIFYEWTPR